MPAEKMAYAPMCISIHACINAVRFTSSMHREIVSGGASAGRREAPSEFMLRRSLRAVVPGGPSSLSKDEIRERIWRLLEERGVARFPRPVRGRIPNFVGAEKAAGRIFSRREFEDAEVIKVNPDAPQIPVRRMALAAGKKLLMPTPRLKRGFMLLDPGRIPKEALRRASTLRGAFKYGRICPPQQIPNVDLIVVGSVAVSRDGIRVGKGGGYSEIEYGILRELRLVDEETPVFTSVHDLQIIDCAPREAHDLTVDLISTPRRLLRIRGRHPRPEGILWEMLTDAQMREMPILHEVRRISK